MLAKSYTAFLSELQRCETLGIRLYNMHPGALEELSNATLVRMYINYWCLLKRHTNGIVEGCYPWLDICRHWQVKPPDHSSLQIADG